MPRPTLSGGAYRPRGTDLLEDPTLHAALVRFCGLSFCVYLHMSDCWITHIETHKSSNISPNEHWQLEVTRDVEDPTWSISYAFSEDEFYVSECSVASFGASMAPRATIFWGEVVIVKFFLLSEEQGDTAEIAHSLARLGGTVGSDSRIDRQKGTWLGRYIMAGGKVKRQVGTRSETIMELKDEIQRIRAAREIFGIDIDDNAAKYIEGRAAALSQTTQRGTINPTPLQI
jgi:hypothetical protein